MVLLAVSTGMPKAGAENDEPDASKLAAVTATDAAVMNAALQDFSARKDLWLGRGAEKKRLVLVHLESDGPSGYLSEDQLGAELDREKWILPRELREALRA